MGGIAIIGASLRDDRSLGHYSLGSIIPLSETILRLGTIPVGNYNSASALLTAVGG